MAWQQGADAIEGDFHLTKDGRTICLHDSDTKRVCGVKRVVKDSTLEELREIHADGFSTSADARLDVTYIDAIRAVGFEYRCWTVNDPVAAKRFIGLGARSMTSNRPEFLRQALKWLPSSSVCG